MNEFYTCISLSLSLSLSFLPFPAASFPPSLPPDLFLSHASVGGALEAYMYGSRPSVCKNNLVCVYSVCLSRPFLSNG